MAKPTGIFISFSGDDPKLRKWLDEFRERVCELSGYTREEVYIFTDPDITRQNVVIRDEISELVVNTEHLICVISNDYLKSLWCLVEYSQYSSRTDDRKSPPLYVVSPFLDENYYKKRKNLQNQLDLGIGKMEENDDLAFSDELREFAKKQWAPNVLEACTTKRHINLHDNKNRTEQEARLKKVLIRPRRRSLVDYAALSAYCLGADRYRNGGWGFSLAGRESEDVDELPNGPYGLNVIVLRALSHFLCKETIRKERGIIFPLKPVTKNPIETVRDRLPYFAGLMNCMENSDAIGFLALHAISAHSSLAGFEPTSRWTLADLAPDPRSDEYHAAVFACLSHAREIQEDKSQDESWSLLRASHFDEDSCLLEKFTWKAEAAIKKNDLFQLLLGDLGTSRPSELAQPARAAMIWLMLAGCSEGQRLLSKHIVDLPIGSRARLIQAVKDGIDRLDAISLTMSLAACAALMSPATEVSESMKDSILDVLYEGLFKRTDSHAIVPELNAVAWASILLIASRELQTGLDVEPLEEMWKNGLSLRDQRLEAVKKLAQQRTPKNAAALDFQKTLEFEKRRSLDNHAKWWVKNISIIPRSGRTAEDLQNGFDEKMASATFWGLKLNKLRESSSADMLSGALRINMISSRIETDSPGYNRIFLRPFSAITGMNVVDLNGIRREFGDQDGILVQMMGETVVQEVYVRSEDGFVSNGRKFIDRTDEIIRCLKRNDWKRENGLDDLLVVLNEERKLRWIHRSAIVQEPRRANADPIISWRFVEIPTKIGQAMSHPMMGEFIKTLSKQA